MLLHNNCFAICRLACRSLVSRLLRFAHASFNFGSVVQSVLPGKPSVCVLLINSSPLLLDSRFTYALILLNSLRFFRERCFACTVSLCSHAYLFDQLGFSMPLKFSLVTTFCLFL